MRKMILHEEVQHDFTSYESSDHYDRFDEVEMAEAMRNAYGVTL